MQYQQHRYAFYSSNLVRISSDYVDFTVNYIDMLDQTCVEFNHKHDSSYEVYYCLSGIHHLEIEGILHTLTAKDFAIIRPGVLHHTVYEPDLFKQYVVFVFNEPIPKSDTCSPDGNLFSRFLTYFEMHTHTVLTDQYDSFMILQRIQREIERSAPLKNLMIRQLYMEYLICILRHLADEHAKESHTPSGNTNLAIEISQFLHANYSRNVTLQDIADHFYISPRHVNRIIGSYFGTTFKHMLNQYRFNYAKNYLIDTDLPIEKICLKVGFSSPKVMYQMFQTYEHMTAAKYREKYKRGQAH